MGRYQSEAIIYTSNVRELNNLLSKLTSDLDSINGLLIDNRDDTLIDGILTEAYNIKNRINSVQLKMNNISSSLSIEAKRLDDILERERIESEPIEGSIDRGVDYGSNTYNHN